MNKKTGQLLIAMVIGLVLVWLSQATIFAQEPCNIVVVTGYDDSDIAIYDSGVITANMYNLAEPNPAYATVTNMASWIDHPITLTFASTIYPTGISRTVAITSFYATIDDRYHSYFQIISSTGVYTGDLSDWVLGENTEFDWNNRRFMLNNNGTPLPQLQAMTFQNVPGDVVGVVVYLWNGNILENGQADMGQWSASGGCTEGGGGADCTTVTDADFTGLPTYENGGWNVAPDNVSIHDGYLDISTDYGEGNTWQVFTPTYRTYTATVQARSASTQTTSASFGILDTSMRGEYLTFTVTETISDDFGTYTFPLQNSLSPGDGAYLYILGGLPGLQIDYICLSTDNGVCANPSERNFTYGNNLNTWSGLAMDDSFSTPLFRRLNIGMMHTDDELPLGGWAQEITTGSLNNIASVIASITGAYIKSPYLIERALAGFQDSINSRYDAVSLQMPGKATLSDLAVEFVWPYNLKTVNFTVLAMVGEEWVPVGNTTINHGDEGFLYNLQGKWSVETINLSLQLVDSPTSYILLSTVSADAELSILAPATLFYITGITTTGCYSGDAYASECVVSDPSLDSGIDGVPDDYFWHWKNANVEAGQITLSAESRSELSQNVYAPAPGAYRITIELLNETSDRCELYARGATEDGYTEDDYFNVLLPCVTSVASQTVTADVLLPDNPFNFILTANRGTATIYNVCFSLPDGDRCLNNNPEFTDGSTGYDGGFTVENGHTILNPGTQIYALPEAQTPFYSGNGPWVLELTASSAVTGETVLSAITPGLNPVDTTITANHYAQISNTQVLTYAVTKTNADQRALILNGNGPSVYNNGATGRMWVQRYCLMTDTGSTWWGNKDCTTVTNPDFLNGLTGWTTSAVAPGLGGLVVFDTNGSVRQTVSVDNLITNPSFEVNTSGWTESDAGNCITEARDTSQYKIGIASAKIVKTCDTSAVYLYAKALPNNTQYTFGIWIKTTGKYQVAILQTNGEGSNSGARTGTGDWEFVTVTRAGASGSGNVWGYISYGASTAGNADYYIDGAVLVAGSSIPVQYASPQAATVHWIAKSGVPAEITATVSVSSTAGVFSTTQVVGPAMEEFFTPFNIGGDVEIKVQGTTAGLELDFVCLNSGTYTEGGPEDGWTPGVGDGRCSQPPMAVLTNTLQSWLPGIWIWSAQPNNYEVIGAYSAAWLRFIGCTLVDLQKMLEVKLNIIIEKLGATSNGGWADALARIFEAIARMVDSLAGILSQLLTLLITIWNDLAPLLGLVWQLIATLIELIEVILDLLLEFIGWLLEMLMTLINMMLAFTVDLTVLPLQLLTAYDQAINDPGYDIIPLSTVPDGGGMGRRSIDIDCSVPESNYWCGILFGFQVVNQTIGATFLYPMVIIGLIVATYLVYRNNFQPQ